MALPAGTAEAVLQYLFPERWKRPTGRPPLQEHQRPPEPLDWSQWILMGGRGSGKTEAGSSYFAQYMNENPGHRGRIIGPTLDDVFESCINGPSGLLAVDPAVRVQPSSPGGAKVVWPNGSQARLLGVPTPKEVERLRATGNRHLDWWEEAAAIKNFADAWDQAAFGLRLGDRPHSILTTTPRNVKKLRELLAEPTTVVTRGTINDNPHLPKSIKIALLKRYEGTRIGRQELDGELLTDVPGALWTWEVIELANTYVPTPDLERIVVAVDPAVTSGEDSDETGIVVTGRGVDERGYVLADYSMRGTPQQWARRAVAAFDEFQADRIVAETNNGGDLVEAVIRTVRPTVPFSKVTASRGKIVRAEPVAALYEQGRVTHVGTFKELEAQMTEFTPSSGDSPDRVDALVWGLTDLGFASRPKRRWTLT